LQNTEKNSEYKIPWKKTCGKTTAEMGRQHHEGLLVAAECKRMEETPNCWRLGPDAGCRAVEKKKKYNKEEED
jgi:hypothetical protein